MKISVPLKVAIGYGFVAIILILAIWLVYANTQALQATSQASQEYDNHQEHTDSLVNLLIDKHNQLAELSASMSKKKTNNIHQKIKDLHSGKDSIIIHPKAPQTHEDKKTVMEVVKTRKGFFNRLADVFKKQHTDTIAITKDSNTTIIDSIASPIDVADTVASVLTEIEEQESKTDQKRQRDITKRVKELERLSADLTRQTDQIINSIQHDDKGKSKQLLAQIQKNNQHLLWQITILALIAIAAAAILLIHIWLDFRRTQQYQESLRQANEETLRVMRQRERLLLTITHDIKAPAASISGFIDLLREHITDKQAIACLDNMRNSSVHLSQLVAALLDYHQLEKGLVELQPTGFNPTELICQCAEGMRMRAETKGLTLTTDTIGIQMPKDKTCHADAFRIRQVLDNLVSNAIKYTTQGSVTIQGKLQNSHLFFSVSDTGQGMTTEESQHIFNAFTRLKGAQGIEGVGLGLSITQELVTLLGGKIKLQTEKGKGSTFTAIIPIELTTATTQKSKENSLFGDAKKLTNNKILILDDDKLQLQLLQEMLRRIGGKKWEVFACGHIPEALTLLHNEQPAMMMMDIEMPEMNGMDFIKHINHHAMTVIAMTAHDASIKKQLQEAGFDGCLFKPFNMDMLAQILGEVPSLPTKPTNGKGRLDALLAFAEGAPEAEREILDTVREELTDYLQALREATANALDQQRISSIAHKLLPIASMAQMECLDLIQSLSPEHINEHKPESIREHTYAIVNELEKLLKNF